jgi:hypothetical protein
MPLQYATGRSWERNWVLHCVKYCFYLKMYIKVGSVTFIGLAREVEWGMTLGLFRNIFEIVHKRVGMGGENRPMYIL